MTANTLGLSTEALRLTTEQPPAWRSRLFAQIIIDEVESCKRAFQKGHRMHGTRMNTITFQELGHWVPERFDEFQNIYSQLTTLINSNHDDAYGSPEKPADVLAIAELSRKIGAFYHRAVEWSQIVRNTPVDSRYAEIPKELASLATSIITGIERFGPDLLQQIDEALNTPSSDVRRPVDVSLHLEIPNMDRFDTVMGRLTNEYKYLSDDISRAIEESETPTGSTSQEG